jgi:hypothetical protein
VLDVTTHNGSGQTESISSRCLAEIVVRGIRVSRDPLRHSDCSYARSTREAGGGVKETYAFI